MLGSILSNILLVLGCCFFAGGIKYSQQKFNDVVASTMSSLMVVSTASLIIPATLYAVMKDTDEDQEKNILILSHGTAVILLVLYVLYLFFQLRTHSELFDAKGEEEEGGEQEADGEQEEGRVLSPTAAGVALVIITVLVAVCAEFLVDSIDSIVETAHISKTFIGLILLPIVGNAAEHVTAVVVAMKNKMDLAIGVAIGSSMQIALLVTPFLVILGWIMGKPMTLHFETFETVVFFLSVLITSYVIAVSFPSPREQLVQRKLTTGQDGKSNYLEGAMLLGMYTIIALAFVSLVLLASYISWLVLTTPSMSTRTMLNTQNSTYCRSCQEARHSLPFQSNNFVKNRSCIYVRCCLGQWQRIQMKRCCNLLLGYHVRPKSPNSIVLVSPYHRIIGLSFERVRLDIAWTLRYFLEIWFVFGFEINVVTGVQQLNRSRKCT